MSTTHSLLNLLEAKKYTKDFYEKSVEKSLDIILSKKFDFTKPLSKADAIEFMTSIDPSMLDCISSISSDDVVDDDIFGFACQQKLVELSENADENQDKMFEFKKFLTYHTIYAEAMKGSPYDKVLQILDGKNPDEQGTISSINENPVEPKAKPRTVIDDIDPKYVDAKFTFKTSKAYQKPQLYKGCKFLKVGDDLSHQYYVDSFDTTTITDDQGIYHQIKDSYPIFTTNKPSVGDIAFALGHWIIAGDKKTLDLLEEASKNISVTFYTTKFNNRKVETIKVKRFACGTTDKNLDEIPYHVEIVYEDIKVNYELDAIAKHYSINHDKLIAREINILDQIKVSLDHPLNVERSEWVMLVGPSGSGKTTVAIDYAKEKGVQYILQQGHAQLTIDDLVGYTSIVKNDAKQSKSDLYVRSSLREAVEHGCIFIIDEIDACNPNTLLALNSLKNKKFQFPDALIDIHPDFRLIATANTLEYSDVFNGRSKLDKATLARFDIINYNLDPHHLAIRYGLDYIKDIKNIDRLEPREIERLVTKQMIEKEKEYTNDN